MTAEVDTGHCEKELLSGLFAAGHLGQLSWTFTRDVIAARDMLFQGSSDKQKVTLGDVLDAAFARLVESYPVEYVFKSCVLNRLLFGRHSPRTTSLYVEFPVGEARADILAVNGQAHVYEIKTRYDDFSRLRSQLGEYYRVFSYVTLFLDERHAAAAMRQLPDHVGIAVLTRRLSMRLVRPAKNYYGDLQQCQLFRVLRESEYLAFLGRHGIHTDTIDPLVRYRYCLETAEELDAVELQAEVTRALKKRQPTVKLAGISQALPDSLRLAPFAYRMTLSQWKAISARMTENF